MNRRFRIGWPIVIGIVFVVVYFILGRPKDGVVAYIVFTGIGASFAAVFVAFIVAAIAEWKAYRLPAPPGVRQHKLHPGYDPNPAPHGAHTLPSVRTPIWKQAGWLLFQTAVVGAFLWWAQFHDPQRRVGLALIAGIGLAIGFTLIFHLTAASLREGRRQMRQVRQRLLSRGPSPLEIDDKPAGDRSKPRTGRQ